jgi:glucans biosynthesis protein
MVLGPAFPGCSGAQDGPFQPDPAGAGFTFAEVEKLARARAGQNFQPGEARVAEAWRGLTEAEWRGLAFKDEHRLWRGENLPFEVAFFHPGFIYDRTVTVEVVEQGRSRPVPFRPEMFRHGGADPGKKLSRDGLNFAGFRLYFPLNDADRKDEVAAFLGANHFRALARHAAYGLTARGLILNPARPEGEEFPYFRRFWLVKPEPEALELTIYALLEAPSLTGAFRFVLKPGGSATTMDVSARLYPRANASRPRKIGLAPVGGMYLHSEKENGAPDDYRPEVHSADALLYSSGPEAWRRRPLNNPRRLEVNGFTLDSPAGFGLTQGDAQFDHYQDLAARFDRRSWLWVEPLDGWAPGRLELMEIPSSQDIHDNILAFWLLAPPAGDGPLQPLSFSYRLYWLPPGSTPHQLGRAAATRLVRDLKNETAEFIIDFESEGLAAVSADTGMASRIETDESHPVLEKSVAKNQVTGGWRLKFKVRLPRPGGVVDSFLPGSEARPRFQARLLKGENLPTPLTETWVYDPPQ